MFGTDGLQRLPPPGGLLRLVPPLIKLNQAFEGVLKLVDRNVRVQPHLIVALEQQRLCLGKLTPPRKRLADQSQGLGGLPAIRRQGHLANLQTFAENRLGLGVFLLAYKSGAKVFERTRDVRVIVG